VANLAHIMFGNSAILPLPGAAVLDEPRTASRAGAVRARPSEHSPLRRGGPAYPTVDLRLYCC